VASGNNTGLNSIQLGLGSDLIFPRLLFPWQFNEDFFEYDIPKTKISLNADYLRRSQLFALGSASATFGYIWNANRYVTHSFDPVAITYVDLINTTPEFEDILKKNSYLQSSFNQQFIVGSLYSFTYNGMVDQNDTHQFFVNTNLDIAGNLLDLISGNSEEGLKLLDDEFPQNTHLWIAAIDQKLDYRGYIVPGLGDAGDLCFGTKKQH